MPGLMTGPMGGAPDDLVLGLDVGGTKLAAGVVAGNGQVLSMEVAPSSVDQGPDAMIERHLDLGRSAVASAGVPWARVRAVGIACGGPLDPYAGIIQSPPGLPGWDDVPLVAKVEAALQRPTVVDNDATACAIAEWWFGAGRARRVRHLVYLTISTGVGGGLVLDGRVVPRRSRECRRAGPSHGGIPRSAMRLRAARLSRGLRVGTADCGTGPRAHGSGSRVVAGGAPRGDGPGRGRGGSGRAIPLASEVWDETAAMLGSAIANILDVFNPELVVLGGGVTRAGDQLLAPVREAALRQAMAPARNAADIVLAGLGEELGVVSAATVAFERLPIDAHRSQTTEPHA